MAVDVIYRGSTGGGGSVVRTRLANYMSSDKLSTYYNIFNICIEMCIDNSSRIITLATQVLQFHLGKP